MVQLRVVSKAFLIAATLLSGLSLAEDGQRQPWSDPLTFLGDIDFGSGMLGEVLAEHENCMAHELTAPGQALHASGAALHASGAVGGFARYPNPNPEFSTVIIPLANPDIPHLLKDQDHASVAILVVDEFSNVYSVDAEARKALVSINWDDPDLVAQTLRDLKTQGVISHGALVMDHINSLIDQMGRYDIVDQNNGRVVWEQKEQGNLLTIIGVDVAYVNGDEISTDRGEIDTDVIASHLEKAIRNISDEVDAIVVNMSFVLLPCGLLKHFSTNGDLMYTFDMYTEDLLDDAGADTSSDNVFIAFSRVISTPIERERHDPLSCLIDFVIPEKAVDKYEEVEATRATEDAVRECRGFDVPQDLRITFIASSGNLNNKHNRLPFPLYPAAWDNVIGVSASIEAGARASFSNPAQVMATGGWFALTDQTPGTAYAGTSFSAPSMAVAAAMYAQCDPLQLPDWMNEPLKDALPILCQ